MKIRVGFVSNSSTASFCIYGVAMEDLDIQEAYVKKFGENDDEDPMVYEMVDKLLNECGGPLGYWNDDYTYYIGRSWDSICDDETGKQFKESIQKDIDEVFGKGNKCSSLEGTYPC